MKMSLMLAAVGSIVGMVGSVWGAERPQCNLAEYRGAYHKSYQNGVTKARAQCEFEWWDDCTELEKTMGLKFVFKMTYLYPAATSDQECRKVRAYCISECFKISGVDQLTCIEGCLQYSHSKLP